MKKDPTDTPTDIKVEQPTQIKSLATQAPSEDTIPPLSAGSSVSKSRIGHVRSESSDQNERGTSESSDDEDSRNTRVGFLLSVRGLLSTIMSCRYVVCQHRHVIFKFSLLYIFFPQTTTDNCSVCSATELIDCFSYDIIRG